MPDILGYDRRTIASKLANQALSAVAGAALNNLSNFGYSHFNRSAMPPIRRTRRPFTRGYRKRRFGKRRSRRFSKKSPSFTGRAFKKRAINKSYKRLNTRMLRNDFDSCRDRHFAGYLQASQITPKWLGINFRITDLDIAVKKYLDYDHYKLTNVQLVITPKYLNRNQALDMSGEAEPYFYVLPRVHPDTITSTPTIQALKTTPGIMKFSLRREKPIILNLGVYLPKKTELVGDQAGNTYTVESPFYYPGWLHNPDESTSIPTQHPKFGSVYLYCPKMEASSAAKPTFTLEYYVTTLFRGNRSLIQQ